MKYANLLNSLAALTVLIASIFKILHLGGTSVNGILTLALLTGYCALAWKTKLLEGEVRVYKAKEELN